MQPQSPSESASPTDIILNEQRKFFETLGCKTVTISVQPESEGSSLLTTKHFSNQNRVRRFSLEEFLSRAVQVELQLLQQNGNAIYFTINEGDGIPKDPDNGNLNCGRRVNIRVLRTLAIDTDEADYGALQKKLAELKLIPTFTVQSSPGKFHIYFVIQPLPAEGENVTRWQSIQKKLASLIPGLDQSLSDINQVLRVPGFFHLKRKPFHRVRVVSSQMTAVYDQKLLYDRLEAHEFDTLSQTLNGYSVNGNLNGSGKHYNPFIMPEGYIEKGSRRTAITRFMESVMGNVINLDPKYDEYFWPIIDNFIRKHIKPAEQSDFLPGGSRRQNLEQYFNDQREYRIRKERQEQSAQAIKEHDHVTAVEDSRLSDQFYRNFPGDLGMLVRHTHDFAPNMSTELAFAGALAVKGALTAETVRFRGAWPLVNGVIIAHSGGNKSTLKTIIETTLKEAGLRGKYPHLLGFQNTVQSLHTNLYMAGGVGTVLIDEAGDYLQQINAKNAPGYAKALRKYFKESTTARGKGSWLHPGGSLSYQVPPIDGGMLSVWMLIQPDKFATNISLEDMADGFLPRFFTFRGKSNIKLTRHVDNSVQVPDFEVPLDLKVWMESLLQLGTLFSDTDIKPILDRTADEIRQQQPRAKTEFIRIAQRDAVYEARSEARNMRKKIEASITPGAQAALMAYLKRWETVAEALQKEDENAPALTIYIRMEEMMMRLLACAVTVKSDRTAVIDEALVDACTAFHKFQVERFFKDEMSAMTQDRDIENVVKAVRAAARKENGPVTVKQIMQAIKGSQRPKSVGVAVKAAVLRGDVWEHEREHAKVKGKKVAVYSLAVSEDGTITQVD